jgi:fibronectin-binding autotransporter adhesin
MKKRYTSVGFYNNQITCVSMRFTRVAGLCLLFALLLSTPANAQIYRSVPGIGNWGSLSSWEIWTGLTWETPSSSQGYPGQYSSPSQVTIRDFSVITINVSLPPQNVIGELVVGEGTGGTLQFGNTNLTLNIGSGGVTVNAGGIFQFGNAAQTLNVNGGSVQVNAGGTFQVTSAPPSTTHTINITGGGSFTNNGTVIFRIVSSGGITDVANLFLSGNLEGTGTSTFNNIQFNGTTNQTITIGGTVAINGTVATTVQFNNTGTAPNNQIINQSVAFTNAISVTPDRTTFTAGNYVHKVNATYLVSNASITIPAAMTVTVEQGTMNFADGNVGAPFLTLNGNLVINGGTVNAGVNTNTTDQFANSLNMNAANASITLDGGQLNVGNTNTGYGNLRMSGNNQSVTVIDGTLRTERWVIGSGSADNQTVTINGGLVRILPTVTTTNRVALDFVQGTLVMNGGEMRIGENLTAISSNLVQLAAGTTDQATTFTINNGVCIVAGNLALTSVAAVNPFNLGVGGTGIANVTLNIGDGLGGDSTAVLLILPNLAPDPTNPPATRNILDMDANDPDQNRIVLRSDGNIKVGGGNLGNLRLNGSGCEVQVLGGKLNITAALALGNGAIFRVDGPGTVNIGTSPSSGANTVTFPANPTTETRFRVDDDDAVVNIGDGNANMVIGNGVTAGTPPNNDAFAQNGFVSFELNRGTVNLNGRFLLNDPNARLVMTGGTFNINPQGDNDVSGALNTCHLQRGIVIMTGGTLTIVNPPANAGTGVAFLVNPQGTPGDGGAGAVLSGDTLAATPVNFSGSLIRFGNGSSTAPGAANEGFEVNLHNSHTYGDFEVNNPSGNNRFVWFYSTPPNSTINLANLNVVAGEFRQGRPAVSPNTIISSASGNFTLGPSAVYRIFNINPGNPFPSGFANYTFTPGSTVEFNGNASQTIAARAYSNLVIAGNGTYTPNSGTTVSGTLTLQGGSLIAGSNLTMGSGSTLRRSNGHILNVTATGGSGYTVGSLVTFTGGGGSGALGIVTATGGGGSNPTIAMINRGSGYTSTPTVSGGGGSGATFTVTIGGGSLSSATDLGNNDYTVEYAGTSQTMGNLEFAGAGPRSLRINAIIGQTITLNAARTLTRTGSVGGNLELQSGNFSDGGFILDVLGTLSGTVDGAHTGTTGRIRLSGTTSQSISGNVTVQNIELDNSAGAALATGAEMTINGQLTLTNGILNVNDRRLTFGLNAPTPLGTFSSSRMIQTSGTPGALGVRKRYQAGVNFFFPVGVPGIYTPARINLIAATGNDFVTLRPVNAEAPTNPGADALQFYWLVTRGTGLTAVTNVSHEYYYENVPGIVEGDATLYVPGRNEPSLTNWTIAGTTADVDEASDPSIIYFNNVPYIDGYFTAGVSAKFNNATIQVFYSGQDGNWGQNTTWRIGSFTGSIPEGVPGGNTPVIIGNNCTVTVPDGSATAVPSVQIQSTGTLRFTGSSMPATDFGLVSGEGRILIETNITPASFPLGTFTDFLGTTGGTVEYGGTATYDLPASPNTYRNLVISGASTKTFPNQDLFISGNLTVQDGAVAQLSNLANGNITLNGTAAGGGNLTVTGTGSVLRFMNGTARTVTVANNVTVGAGATFDVATTGTAVANELSIGGNLTNNGTFDMSDGTGASVRRARVTFTGTSNATISGTGATTDFNVLRVNKGTSQTPILDVTASNFTLSGPTTTDKSLVLENGTFRVSAGHTITLSTGSPNYIIPDKARLWVNHPSAIARIQSGSSDNQLVLEGTLQLSDGQIQIGNDNTGVAENSIVYRNNTSVIEVSGGTMTIGGAIRPENSTSPTKLIYTQSGGTVILSNNRANAPSAASPGVNQITVADLLIRNGSSQFNMSGGLLRIDRRNPAGGAGGGAAGVAIRIDDALHNVTGGTVQVISSATNVNQPCAIVSVVPFWNLQIGDGTSYTANVGSAQAIPQGFVFVVLNDFTLNTGGEFRLYRVTGTDGQEPRNFTVGGNFTVQNGTFAVGSTSTVTFNGSGLSGQSAPQVITRTGGGTITFRNVTLNNTASPNTVQLGANTDLAIIGNWTTTAGAFDAETNTRTVTFNGTTAQTINGTTDFYNLTINNAAGVTLASGTLGIRNTVGSGGVLTLTSGVLDIGNNGLVIRNTDNTAIGGTPSATNMIRTSGSVSATGVTKHYNATGNFTFPIGTGTNYTPAQLNVTASDDQGTITVAPVDARHPLATGSNNALLYYWRVTSTGLDNPTVSHTYQYPDAITEEGNTALYQGGYYVPTTWTTNAAFTRTAGPPRTVVFPNINVIQGDFTVGEPSAFGTLTVYYSLGGNWNVAGSWSTVGFGGQAANSTPGPGNPVIIGDNQTIIIPAAGTVNGASTEIQATGTLVVQRTTVPPIGTISGNGRLRYDVTATPTLPPLDASFQASGTVEYANAAGNYTLPTTPTTYGNLEISAGIKTLAANTTINGNLTISGGTLNMQGFTLNRASSGGTMTMDPGTTLTLTGTNNFPANYGTYSLATTSTVDYTANANQTANQTIAAVTYGNLTFSGGGTNNRTLAGATTVQGNLTINAGKTLVTSNNNLTVGGNFNLAAGTANFNGGTSTVTFNGTGPQAITRTGGGTLTFNNMTVNKSGGTLTLATAAAASTLSVPGTLTLTSGAFAIGGSAAFPNTLALGGTVSGTGTITGSLNSDMSITGTGALGTLNFTAGGQTLRRLTVNRTGSSPTVTLGTNLTVGQGINNPDSLYLFSGIIQTGTNVLTLANQSQFGHGSPSAFVDGILRMTYPATPTARFFPIAGDGIYRPVSVSGTATAGTQVTVRMINAAPPGIPGAGLNNLSGVRYYQIERSGGTFSSTPRVQLSINTVDPVDEFASNPGGLTVASTTDNPLTSLTVWQAGGNPAAAFTPFPAAIVSADIASLSSSSPVFVTAASTVPNDNPLPVELISFAITAVDEGVKLKWETASEVENAGFILSRSRFRDGGFEELASYRTHEALVGKGTSATGGKYEWIDKSKLLPGETYYYKLEDVDFNGVIHTTEIKEFVMPKEYSLSQNYPNPFNSSTVVEFNLRMPGRTVLEVYNVLGQRVMTVVDGELSAGSYRYQVNLSGLASGMYLYRLRSRDFVATKKMLLIK